MTYRVLDLFNSIEVRYSEEEGSERYRPYSLQDVKELLVRRVTEAIEVGRCINLTIIDQDSRVVEHVAVNVFS